MDFNALDLGEGNMTSRINEGILYYKETPIYYIIYVEEFGEEYVLVYNIQDKEAKEPTRAYKRVPKNKTDELLPGGTQLSDMVRSKVGDKIEYLTVYEEPLFVAVVVPNKQDSLRGNFGKGFYERKPEGKRYKTKGVKEIGGGYTGLFLTLDSIKWIKSYVPLESVIAEYQRVKEERINV